MKTTRVLVSLLFIAFIAGPARASQWDAQKGQCDQVFRGYDTADLALLKQCVMMWEAYKPTVEIEPEDQAMLRPALNRLYHSGDEEAKFYATQSMQRMKITPSEAPTKGPARKQYHSEKVKKKKAPKRTKYVARDATKAEQKAADSLVRKGLKQHKRARYRKALDLYQRALDKDPGHVGALYNAACAYSLDADKDNAVEYLQRLVDLGTRGATAKVKKARADRDFEPVRDDPDFKRVTGFARVKVVNGVGEYGDEEVERISKTLEQLGYDVTPGGADKHDRSYPIVWYKKHAKATAYVVSKAVNHPKTKFQVIDWDSQSDLIVSWGDIIRKNKFGDPIVKSYGPKDPDEAEAQMQDLLWEEDKALREPDKVSRKVEHTAGTPQRTKMRVEQGARRVGDSIDRVQRAGEKAGSLFK